MFRKWMTVFLCLMLSVMLPVTALADTQHTISVVPGALLADQTAVADLLDGLALRVTEGESSGALTVLLNNQPMVTLGLKADETGLYASSELLGDGVFYAPWDDCFAFLSDVLVAPMGEIGMDEAILQEMETAFAEAQNVIADALAAGPEAAVKPVAPAAMEESLKQVEAMFPDDPAMMDYVKGVYENITIEAGNFADENRDTADQKYRMAMDETDLVVLCETQYMKRALREALAVEMAGASEAELDSAVENALAEVKKFYEESGFEMVVEMYTLNAGQTLAGLDMIVNMNAEAAEQGAVQMAGQYDRLTEETGVSYKADAAIAAEGETVKFAFELQQADNGISEGMLGLLTDGEEAVILYRSEKKAEETYEHSFDLYLRSGATAILEPAASARPVIGLKMRTEPASAETLAALENAAAETSVDVFKLSEKQLKELTNQITLNATQLLYTALGQLPTSVLQLMMDSGMMGR